MAFNNFSTYVEWMWRADSNPASSSEQEEWRSYSEEESRIIEKAYNAGQSRVRLNSRYEIDFGHSVQIATKETWKQRLVKRVVHNKESWIKLEGVLGEGHFGIVYRGIYRGSQEVACKVAKTQLSEVDKNEINVLKTLHHPNIIRYIDVIYTSREMFVVMELIDNGTLLTYIRNTPESLNYWCTSRNIMIDVAYGMCYLHEKNTVHADLKSDNILLRKSGKAVVSDFGLSTVIEDAMTRHNNSATGACRWLAPELCSSRPENSSFLSDIWAFGCVLLEIITKRWPWLKEYQNDLKLLHALSQEENAAYFDEICRKQQAPKKIRTILCACCTWPKRNRPNFVNILKDLNSILDTDLEPQNERHITSNSTWVPNFQHPGNVQSRCQTAPSRHIRKLDDPYANKKLNSYEDDEDDFTSAGNRNYAYSPSPHSKTVTSRRSAVRDESPSNTYSSYRSKYEDDSDE